MDHAAPCCGAPTGRSSLRLQVFWGGSYASEENER